MLGRDATSVFPTESKTEVVRSDAAKELLGSSNRFITESEVGCFKGAIHQLVPQMTHNAPTLHLMIDNVNMTPLLNNS